MKKKNKILLINHRNMMRNYEDTIHDDKTTIVYFFKNNNEECNRFDKVFEEAFLHYPDINWVKVDTKEIQVLTPRYQIKTLPGIMLFYRGNEITRFIGYKDTYEFQNFIEKYKR